MPVPRAPETTILEAMKAVVVDADLQAAFGLAEPFTVRHYRHRKAGKSEKPGVSLRYDGTDVDADRGQFHTSSEVCWRMSVAAVVDMALLPEKANDLPAADDNDATGWDRLAGISRYIAGLFVAMDSPLRLVVDDIAYGDVDPDEDSQPDEGRLAISVDVLYRTLFDDPLHLLSPEENA